MSIWLTMQNNEYSNMIPVSKRNQFNSIQSFFLKIRTLFLFGTSLSRDVYLIANLGYCKSCFVSITQLEY